jgi:hypothetical protein
MSIANSGMLLYLVFGQVRNYYGWNFDITYVFPMMFFGTILGLLVFGYFEDKSGIHQAEQQITYTRNPQLKEILERLERIEKKVDVKDGV